MTGRPLIVVHWLQADNRKHPGPQVGELLEAGLGSFLVGDA